jgi:hypothetical protein
MYLDHANSSRLGQRPPVTATNVLRVAVDADRPTNASHGQVAFVEDTQKSYIWNANARADGQVVGDVPDGAWEPFGGGIEFYAQPEPPATAGFAAFWLDTEP